MARSRFTLICILLAFALLGAACSESDDGGDEGAITGFESTTTEADSTATSADGTAESSTSEGGSADADDGNTDGEEPDLDSVVGNFAGEEWIFGTVPATPVAADDSLEPVRLGLINQENSAAGAFPEIRGAIDAAITFVNTELGGVGGRPITLETCDANLDPTISQACAQQMVQAGVIALVGGIDIGSTGSIPVLQANGIPQLGGIPANIDEQQAENFFFFSGGTVGGVAAMMKHAADSGATKVYLGYGDFGAFTVAAEEYGVPAGEELGLEVISESFDLLAPDFLDVLTKAEASGAEAVILLAADTACTQAIPLFPEVVPDAQLYMTGACAIGEIAEALGDDLEIIIMNNEGPNESTVEGSIYQAVVDKYATDPADGAGTVGFRGFMNLYSIMSEIGPDDLTSEAISELTESTVERPSYWGFPITCAEELIPGLPSLCAPQQTLMQMVDGEIVDAGDGEVIDPAPLLENAGPNR